jgi:hypothetical protein
MILIAIATNPVAPMIIKLANSIVLLQGKLILGATVLKCDRAKYRKAPDNFRKGGDRFNVPRQENCKCREEYRKAGDDL